MATKTDIDLLRCPFCGGQAEMDTRQGYLALGTGRLGNRIAVYCRQCDADMGVCIEDVPYITPEQVAEMWNRRAAVEADRQHNDTTLAHEWIRPALNLPDNAPYRFDFYAQKIGELMADRRGRGTILDDPVLNAIIRYGDARASMTEARCADAPYDRQVAAADDTTEAYTDLCALLTRYSSGQPKPSNSTELKQPAASAEPAVWVAADTLYSAHPMCISSLAYMSQTDHDRGREYVPLAIINHHAAPVAQEPVQSDSFRACAIGDSNYAAGMLLGWNLCIDGNEEQFNQTREARLRAAAQASRAAKSQEAAPVAAQAQRCNHVYEARPIDGTTRASAQCEPVCRKCGYRPAVQAAKGEA